MDVDYDERIVKVLQKLLQPDFTLKDDSYLNCLLTHLKTDPENGCEENWRSATKKYLPTWIQEAVLQWEKKGTCRNSAILSFALNLTSFICKDEQTFVILNSRNIYERLITLLNVNKSTTAASIKLGYVRLVCSFLEHKSGLQWIISTNYWADILSLALENRTVFITKEGYKFVATLLVKSIKINESFCSNVVQLVLAPLSSNSPCVPHATITNVMEIRDQAIYQSLCTSLSLLTEVLEILLENIATDSYNKVFQMLCEKFNLEERVNAVLLYAQNEEFIFDLYRILFIISLFDLYVEFGGKDQFVECEGLVMKSKMFEILTANVEKGYVVNIIKLSYIGHSYWKHIEKWMPLYVKKADDPEPMLFENQVLMLQLYPIIAVSFKILGQEASEDMMLDEVREHYIDEILKKSSQHTIRLFFLWRNYLVNNPYIFDHSTLALNYLIKSMDIYKRDLGVIVFQTLMYSFLDIVKALKEQRAEFLTVVKDYNYLALLLDTITRFINKFNFTWRDSLESICVMNLAFEFLSFPTWPTKLVVNGLKLINVAISKYLTPNMALLIDNFKDSTMTAVGPMVYAKLHDGAWEVRDTALEVVCTFSHNANKKFPSFRNIILDADLSSLALKMALDDGESYVRATAVKCLQEMVKVQEIWGSISKNHNIHEKVIEILQNETEGIVRSEAASLVATIYEAHEIPANVLTKYYDIMTHAVTGDLHWEVKVNALKFWQKVIDRHLTHQGMIDGTFPKVTFSKEHRKIVTLTDQEIKKRLVKVLNQLSETGCLAVLLLALQDDCDLEVSKSATKITTEFVKLLKSYNVQSSIANLRTPPSPLCSFNGVPSPPYSNAQIPSPLSQVSENSQQNNCMDHYDVTDSILDEIINSQDMQLLRDVYNPSSAPSGSCNGVQLRFRQVVTPCDFLKTADSDLELRVNNRENWLRDLDTFGSLLDDILKEYDNGDVNSMDCY